MACKISQSLIRMCKWTDDSWRYDVLQIPVVAAEQFREGCADGSAMSIHHQLQHVLVHFHHHRCRLGVRHEEDDSEESDLKLRTDADEGAADRFDQTLPAELQVQDVVVFIRL